MFNSNLLKYVRGAVQKYGTVGNYTRTIEKMINLLMVSEMYTCTVFFTSSSCRFKHFYIVKEAVAVWDFNQFQLVFSIASFSQNF